MELRQRNRGVFALRVTGSLILMLVAAALASLSIASREVRRALGDDGLWLAVVPQVDVGPLVDGPLRSVEQAAVQLGLSLDAGTLASLRQAGEQSARSALDSCAKQAAAMMRGERQALDVQVDLLGVQEAAVNLAVAKAPMAALLRPVLRSAVAAVVPPSLPLGPRLVSLEALLGAARVGVVSLERLTVPLGVLAAVLLGLSLVAAFSWRLALGSAVSFCLVVSGVLLLVPSVTPAALEPVLSRATASLAQWSVLGLVVGGILAGIAVAVHVLLQRLSSSSPRLR